MVYQFEKILKDNNIAENDADLPRSITKQIEKFRKKQLELETVTDAPGKEKINDELDEIDNLIMKTLPDHFEMEDEAELERKAELSKRAIAVGLKSDATESEIIKAETKKAAADQVEKDKKDALTKRAKAVGLQPEATESDIIKAETKKAGEDQTEKEKKIALSKRAKAVGLKDDATESEIIKAETKKAGEEQTEKEKKSALTKRAKAIGLPDDATETEIETAETQKATDQAAEEKKPATTNIGALEKLHKAGKTTVTVDELKAAGFNTGFLGPIGPFGWNGGTYSISRANSMSSTFTLTKKE